MSPTDVPRKGLGLGLVHVLSFGARLTRRLVLGLQFFLFRSQIPHQLRRKLFQTFNEVSASSTARARKEQHTNALFVVRRIMVLTNVGYGQRGPMAVVAVGPDQKYIDSSLPMTSTSSPCPSVFWCGSSRCQQIGLALRARGVSFKFAPRPLRDNCANMLDEESVDPYEYVRTAQSAHHPLLAPHIIDDTAIFALEIQAQLGPDVPRWRAEMIAEIAEIRHECSDETQL